MPTYIIFAVAVLMIRNIQLVYPHIYGCRYARMIQLTYEVRFEKNKDDK